MKLKGLDPTSGAHLDDTEFQPAEGPAEKGKVRPLFKSDGSDSGDLLKRPFVPEEALPPMKLIEFLNRQKEREKRLPRQEAFRLRVMRAYLFASKRAHRRTLTGVNLQLKV